MKKYLAIIIIAAIAAAGAWWLVYERGQHGPYVAEPEMTGDELAKLNSDRQKVNDYLHANISAVSPEKAVLGGTFYVTSVTFNGSDKGHVSYEDGHNAFTAEFTYKVDAQGNVKITSWKEVSPAQ